jgi:hypothetical protein
MLVADDEFQRFVLLNRLVSRSATRAPEAFKPPIVEGSELFTILEERNASGAAIERKSPQRLTFNSIDRLVFAGLYRRAPGVLDTLKIVRPETVIGWDRAGFRTYWRWKSRPRGGRPKTPLEIRQLIREISLANPLSGAPRLHGEFLKLGIDVGQTTVAKYYIGRGRRPPSQGWKTFP